MSQIRMMGQWFQELSTTSHAECPTDHCLQPPQKCGQSLKTKTFCHKAEHGFRTICLGRAGFVTRAGAAWDQKVGHSDSLLLWVVVQDGLAHGVGSKTQGIYSQHCWLSCSTFWSGPDRHGFLSPGYVPTFSRSIPIHGQSVQSEKQRLLQIVLSLRLSARRQVPWTAIGATRFRIEMIDEFIKRRSSALALCLVAFPSWSSRRYGTFLQDIGRDRKSKRALAIRGENSVSASNTK